MTALSVVARVLLVLIRSHTAREVGKIVIRGAAAQLIRALRRHSRSRSLSGR